MSDVIKLKNVGPRHDQCCGNEEHLQSWFEPAVLKENFFEKNQTTQKQCVALKEMMENLPCV